MIKRLKIFITLFLLLFILSGIGFFILLFILRSSQDYPYPYQFKQPVENPNYHSNQADIVILGDKFGVHLSNFQEKIILDIEKERTIDSKLTWLNLATQGEGLHRSLQKLKALPTRPKLIIYHGGSDEFKELPYLLNQFSIFKKNYHRFQSPISKGLIHRFPWMSKFIFLPMEKAIIYPEIPSISAQIPDHLSFENLQMNNWLYSLHIDELINYSKSNNIKLILIPTSINLEILPKKVCLSSTKKDLLLIQDEIFQLMDTKQWKLANNKVTQLIDLSPGNALTHFLKGTIEKELGEWDKARISLEHAASLDCGFWRTSLVNNQILINLGKKYDIKTIDFHALIHLFWGKNILFVDEIYPQHLYYELLSQAIAKAIIEVLQL